MRKLFALIVPLVGLLGLASNGQAQTYLKICSLYGLGFYYIPGTDICLNTLTRDAREQSPGGTWRTQVPYTEGDWVADPAAECSPGMLYKVGSFKSTQFTVDKYSRKVTAPYNLTLNNNQFISKVMMSGGFYDPRTPGQAGVNGAGAIPIDGLCLREEDPDVVIPPPPGGGDPEHPDYANLAVGCISNSRIVNSPGVYSITSTLAYPQIFNFGDDPSGNDVVGPLVFGDQLIVTTDFGPTGPRALTYCDATAGSCDGGVYDDTTQTYSPLGPGVKPLAGTLNVWACVETGQ